MWTHMNAVITLVLQVIFRFIDCPAKASLLISAEKAAGQCKERR